MGGTCLKPLQKNLKNFCTNTQLANRNVAKTGWLPAYIEFVKTPMQNITFLGVKKSYHMLFFNSLLAITINFELVGLVYIGQLQLNWG